MAEPNTEGDFLRPTFEDNTTHRKKKKRSHEINLPLPPQLFPQHIHNIIQEPEQQVASPAKSGLMEFIKENKITIIITIIIILSIICLYLWLNSKDKKESTTQPTPTPPPLPPQKPPATASLPPMHKNTPVTKTSNEQIKTNQHDTLVKTTDDNELQKYMNLEPDTNKSKSEQPTAEKKNVRFKEPVVTESTKPNSQDDGSDNDDLFDDI